MNLVESIRTIQRAVGAEADGVFGPQSASKVLEHLRRVEMVEPAGETPAPLLDARTLKTIATLDEKARGRFEDFVTLAKATAATFGCNYIAISGARDWNEQEALYKKYQAGGPKAAPPGYSWHNFKLAADFGVFLNGGTIYLDNGTAQQQALAERVHAACSVHARECGLVWGGTFKGKSFDSPHYQYDLGHKTPTAADRAKFKQEGSLL